MAEFKPIFDTTLKKEGGFQKFPNDSANYVNGVLIGTNKGISAQAYASYYKKTPTEADMKALTHDQAYEIFKKNYWNKVNGDKVKNQSVAQLMFQYIIGSGASQLSDLKAIANSTAGKKLIAEVDVPFTDKEVEIINGLNQKNYWDNLKKWRNDFFIRLTNSKPELKQFLKGWQSRLNSYTFSGAIEDIGNTIQNNSGKIIMFIFLFSMLAGGVVLINSKS